MHDLHSMKAWGPINTGQFSWAEKHIADACTMKSHVIDRLFPTTSI